MMKNKTITMKTLKKLAACLLLLVMLPISALAAYDAVTTSAIKVYSTNKAQSAYYLGTVGKNVGITVNAVSGNWAKITYKGRVGYTEKKYLNANKTAVYTKKSTTVYATPSKNGKVVDTLTADFPLYAIGKGSPYTYITNVSGSGKGYVLTSNLGTSKANRFAVPASKKISFNSNGSTTSMPAAVKSTQSYVSKSMSRAKKVEYMIYGAQSKLGCRYAASGYNNTNTFSNGSFVQACFDWMGYSISNRPKDIGHTGKYAYVSRQNLKRGDIVCFECDTNDDQIVDHVGIYLGNGYFIHASSSAKCVIVSKMSSGYYYNAFCWGRRVF